MNPRPRDFQRSKVYAAERSVWNNAKRGGTGEFFQALVDLEAEARRIIEATPELRWPVWPVVVKDGRGRRSAGALGRNWSTGRGYYKGEIRMPKWSRSQAVLCHELAHLVVGRDNAGHGSAFAAVVVYLLDKAGVKNNAGGSLAEAFAEAYQTGGVRVAASIGDFMRKPKATTKPKAKAKGPGGARPGSGRPALPKSQRKVQITAQVDPKVLKGLKRRAKAEGVRVSWLVNNLLDNALWAIREDGQAG